VFAKEWDDAACQGDTRLRTLNELHPFQSGVSAGSVYGVVTDDPTGLLIR